MAKFRFQLAPLKKLREAYRDELQGKLAEAYQAEQLLEEQITTTTQQIERCLEQNRDSLASNTADANSLLDAQRYLTVLRTQQATLYKQHELVSAEVQKRHQAVVEANRQVRMLDKLHDRKLDAHRRAQVLLEHKQMDEIASRSREVADE